MRTEDERSSGANVEVAMNLLVGTGGVGSTSAPPQRGGGQGTALSCGARGTTHRGGSGAPPCVGWGAARWSVDGGQWGSDGVWRGDRRGEGWGRCATCGGKVERRRGEAATRSEASGDWGF